MLAMPLKFDYDNLTKKSSASLGSGLKLFATKKVFGLKKYWVLKWLNIYWFCPFRGQNARIKHSIKRRKL